MLAEEFGQIAEGFVEVPVNLQAQIKKVEEISRMVNNVDSKSYIDKTILWKTVTSSKIWKALCDIIHKVESAICLLTKLPQCGKYANKTSTMRKVC